MAKSLSPAPKLRINPLAGVQKVPLAQAIAMLNLPGRPTSPETQMEARLRAGLQTPPDQQ
jgi:hypothetical protein